MAITSNLKAYPVSWLVDRRKEGNINTDISLQRQAVWSHLNQSNLIAAILNGVPIPNLWLEKAGKKGGMLNYNAIDGKQRTLTLAAYLADAFPLSAKMRYTTADEIDIVGKKFSELDKSLQHKLMDTQLSITVFEPMTAEERALVFFMGNQSVPLTSIHYLPVVLGETVMDKLNELCRHSFIDDKVKLTAPALRKRDDLKIIVHYMVIKSGRDIGFAGKQILSFCDLIKSGDEPINEEEIIKILDYLNEAIPKKRHYLRLTHVPTIMYVAQLAIEKGMNPEELGNRLENFFAGDIDEYKAAGLQGSSKKSNIQTRVNIMKEILN